MELVKIEYCIFDPSSSHKADDTKRANLSHFHEDYPLF